MTDGSPEKDIAQALDLFALVDIDQSAGLPTYSYDHFLQNFEAQHSDLHASLTSKLDALLKATQEQYRIPERAINACYFVDLLFARLGQSPEIDNTLYVALLPTKMVFLRTLLNDSSFFYSPKHYLKRYYSELFSATAGWTEALQNAAPDYWLTLASTIDALGNITGKELDAPTQNKKYLNRLHEQKSLHIDAINLTRKAELKRYDLGGAQRMVDDVLDKITEGKLFPANIAHFIKTAWRETLLHYRSSGVYTPQTWAHLRAFTEDFCQLFSLDGKPKSDMIISTVRPTLIKILPEHKDKLLIIEDIVKTFAKLHAVKLESGVKVLPFLERNRLKHIQFSSSIIKNITALPHGQWILFSEGDLAGKKFQLTDKLSEHQQILLINAIGTEAKIISFQELAYRITSKKAHLLSSENAFDKAVSDAIKVYLEQFSAGKILKTQKDLSEIEKLKKALTHACNKIDELNTQLNNISEELHQQQKSAHQNIQQLQAKLDDANETIRHREADIIDLKQQKTELEIHYLSELDALSQSKTAVERHNQAVLDSLRKEKSSLAEQLKLKNEQNRHYEIVQAVKSLTIGSWLSIIDENGQTLHCKIAIIYSSSGKYVLVNGKGLSVGEYLAEQLIEMLATGNATILQRAGSFDNSMETIIKSLK